MKCLTPFVLTIAIVAVSAADDLTSASLLMSSSLPSSSSGSSVELFGLESASEASSASAASFSDDSLDSSASGDFGSVDEDASFIDDSLSGSDEFNIESISSLGDDFSSSMLGTGTDIDADALKRLPQLPPARQWTQDRAQGLPVSNPLRFIRLQRSSLPLGLSFNTLEVDFLKS
ncbi:unnamed protein product [Peronospora destructor]|uniref:Secreted protein n=1 Tax=Peronospora destructor TaxID=86335 RepID=A0AAV0URH5_9STRA|nr:unnamed protein product [Peronospora destructor]